MPAQGTLNICPRCPASTSSRATRDYKAYGYCRRHQWVCYSPPSVPEHASWINPMGHACEKCGVACPPELLRAYEAAQAAARERKLEEERIRLAEEARIDERRRRQALDEEVAKAEREAWGVDEGDEERWLEEEEIVRRIAELESEERVKRVGTEKEEQEEEMEDIDLSDPEDEQEEDYVLSFGDAEEWLIVDTVETGTGLSPNVVGREDAVFLGMSDD